MGDGEKTTLQHFEPFGTTEAVFFVVRADGEKVGTTLAQAVRGGMRPGSVRICHEKKDDLTGRNRQALWRMRRAQPGGVQQFAPASWSAAVLCRLREPDMPAAHRRLPPPFRAPRIASSETVAIGMSANRDRAPCQGGTGLPHSTTLARFPTLLRSRDRRFSEDYSQDSTV